MITGKYCSMSDDLVAATMREDLKKRRYRGVLGENCSGFLPFVVEATGRLGPLAGKWVNCIKDSQSGAEQYTGRFILMSQLGGLIAKFNAKMGVRWAKGMVAMTNADYLRQFSANNYNIQLNTTLNSST